MDQTLILVISIAVLSGVLVIVGVYSLMVLHDFRKTLGHANKILGQLEGITEHLDSNLIRPASSIAGILAVLKEGAQVVHEIKEIAEDAPKTAEVVTESAKEITQVIGDQAKEVVANVKEGSQEVAAEVTHQAAEEVKETSAEVAGRAKEVIAEARRPEPMASRSLAPRRRFFSRKK